MSATKREKVNPSRAVRASKRSVPRPSAAHPNRQKTNIRAGREPVHPSPQHPNAK